MQKKDELLSLISSGKNVSILSQGGTGKSTLISAVQKDIESRFYVTSTTGVSAYLIRGSTIHSYSGIGVLRSNNTVKDVVTKIKKNKQAKLRIENTEILVIDEISMLGGSYFDMLNACFKIIRKNNKPFGGMTVIVTGDFYQLSPINDTYVFETETWREMDFHNIHLETVYRFTDDLYRDMLTRIRTGKHTPEDNVELYKRVKAFNELDTDSMEIKPTFLTSKRIDVDEENREELRKNPNELVIYKAFDEYKKLEKENENEKEKENTFDILSLVSSKNLELKVGAQVMLLVNINVEDGLTNGARGVVVKLESEYVHVKFMTGETIPFERHVFPFERDGKVVATRSQFPFCLAYALTIHKIQGSTLDLAVIDIGNSIFQAHMTYVALSRVRSLSGLYIKSFNPHRIMVDQRVTDFYKD
jgi:ATP-dependent DNA helicase PIF1